MYRKYFQSARQCRNLLASSHNLILLGANHENLTQKRWAGHSKWQNIKSTKEAMDHARNVAFHKMIKLINNAVKEGGDDMSMNSKLRALWDEAQKISMPKSTFESRVKAAKNQATDKPYWIVFSGPKGFLVAFEVLFANKNPSFLIGKFSLLKKLKMKMEVHFQDYCIEKGIIITDPLPDIDNAYETALEHAIEIGVNEVFENDDKTLIFECNPDRVDSLQKQLQNLGYNIYSASKELNFKEFITINEEETEAVEALINKLKGLHPEIIRTSYNAVKS